MRFVFESSVMMPHISEMLSVLVGGARIHVDNIQYNESQRKVEILMERKELIGFKKSLFGSKQPIYSQNVLKTLLIVNDAIGMNIRMDDRLAAKLNSSFTVLFGEKLNNNELYLGSVEESQGEIFCQVSIKMEGLNIECIDLEN
jgi:hypothetical protein